MEYKISSVKFFSEQTYGRDNNHRVMVNFEGQEKDYSAFVKTKPSVGDVWFGEVKKTEKDDKIYWNFTFAPEKKTDSSPAASNGATAELKNILMLKVIPMLQDILEKLPSKVEYPEYKEGVNDSSGFDVPFDQ